MKKIIFLLILAAFGCKTETVQKTEVEETKQITPKKYTLTPFGPSTEFADAKLENMSYVDGKFDFKYSGSDYVLGEQTADAPQKMCANSAEGQHIHLIIDNAPYLAKYQATFDHSIDDGEHYLLAFLSRSYHESLKNPEAHIAKKITVQNKSITNVAPITEPSIFYSRPKGNYVGKAETEKVMLDFYPVNAEIGKTHKIIALINGEEHQIDKWQPYYITGLPYGENSIELTLVDSNNNKIDSPNLSVKRTFNLAEDQLSR